MSLRVWRRCAVLGSALLVASSSGLAQGTTPPVKPDTAVKADTVKKPVTKADSVRVLADSLRKAKLSEEVALTKKKLEIKWEPADSAMEALLAREGYIVTRYQGNKVIFQAKEKNMYLVGKRAAVQRDSTAVVSDTIQFNDSTQVMQARGDTITLRDPAQGEDDVVALGSLRYDVPSRTGIVRNVTTAVESGQRWIVHGAVAAFKGDTGTTNRSTFYAQNGWLTSCEEVEPHFHFGASEMKLISRNVMVVRPAILYIKDIPILWLPFVFNDMRTGRRSGLIAPNIGFNQIFRQSAFMRRTVEDIGYHFAINDYLNAAVTLDWRSDARGTDIDPGYIRYRGLLEYAWKERYVNGRFEVSRNLLKNGATNATYSFSHRQDFSSRTNFNVDFNYTSDTRIQRQTTFNPVLALQTIRSMANFVTGRGPFTLNVGGTQTQYPGRDQVNRDFPSLRISSKPIEIGEWLTWTPGLTIANSESLNQDGASDFPYRYFPKVSGIGLDSARVKRDSRRSSISFDSPLQIFGFNLRNAIRLSDVIDDYPARYVVIPNVRDTSVKVSRVYASSYTSGLDWETGFSLPSFFQGTWNLAPSLNFQKVDNGSPLIVRTERTGGEWVSQSFRPAAGVSISPKLYAFFPGFGRIQQIRHSIEPMLSYQWSPRGTVTDEFLAATKRARPGYLGALPQSIVSLGFNSVFEAKMRPDDSEASRSATDSTGSATRPTTAGQSTKVRLLALQFTSLAYDFVRARESKGGNGLTNTTFDVGATSELLPGFQFGVTYSLYQGDPMSDTAVFKPYREGIRTSMNLDAKSPIVRLVARLIGIHLPSPAELKRQADLAQAQERANQRVNQNAGMGGGLASQSLSRGVSGAFSQIPQGAGWRADLSFTAQRQRPPVGDNVQDYDPRARCDVYKDDPFTYDLCKAQFIQSGGTDGTPYFNDNRGRTFFRMPPQSNVNGSLSFHLTEKWAASWRTSYDFETRDFAQHTVSLQRAMHDWDAIFGFLKSPNGNFSFTFHIALRAQPDIKFDYDRPTFPRGYTGRRLQ